VTKAIRFTKAQIKRAIEGARDAGLRVSGVEIKPDGTICVNEVDKNEEIAKVLPEPWE